MHFPSQDNTIVALSSGWEPSAVGIVRLSGAESFALAERLGAVAPPPAPDLPGGPRTGDAELSLGEGLVVPATVFWFAAPRSYTGQDVVELHVPGCLPLLREMCKVLIGLGARRALPGEFTARAFLAGKLGADEVERVLALLHAGNIAELREARRSVRTGQSERLARVREDLEDLLAQVEAGIDFADEEDIRFVSAPEALARTDLALAALDSVLHARDARSQPARPQVALAGPPNAGKSTLFNALVGYERAIVSPVIGTTRDVLCAEITIAGQTCVLQDCAGLGDSEDELELAARLAAETAAEQADLVLWLHPSDKAWTERETHVLARIPAERRLIVLSKADLRDRASDSAVPFEVAAEIAVQAGWGLSGLRCALAGRLSTVEPGAAGLPRDGLETGRQALGRARELLCEAGGILAPMELVAAELRCAVLALAGTAHGEAVEQVLGRIFTQFCVGK